MPARKPYTPMGQTGAASAAGGPQVPGMGMPPQAGRTGPQLPMPMAGNSRPSPGGPGEVPGGAGGPGMPGMDELPLPMGPGGPTAPLNVQAQGMLRTKQMPKRVPVAQDDVFGQPGGAEGGPLGAPPAPGGGLPQGQMQPDVMMKLMQMLKGGAGVGGGVGAGGGF